MQPRIFGSAILTFVLIVAAIHVLGIRLTTVDAQHQASLDRQTAARLQEDNNEFRRELKDLRRQNQELLNLLDTLGADNESASPNIFQVPGSITKLPKERSTDTRIVERNTTNNSKNDDNNDNNDDDNKSPPIVNVPDIPDVPKLPELPKVKVPDLPSIGDSGKDLLDGTPLDGLLK